MVKAVHELSPAYVKQGNGIAERENRILCDTARSLLHATDLSKDEKNWLWAEAVNTAAYIRNRVPNNRTGDTVTPYERWHKTKPDVSHVRVFGSAAFVKIPEQKRKQFDPKSRKTVLVGYDAATTKVFRVFDRNTRKVERVSDVVIDESDASVVSALPSFRDEVTLSYPNDTNDDAQEDNDHGTETESRNDSEEDDFFADGADEQPIEKRKPGRPLGSKNKPKPPPQPHEMRTRNKVENQIAMIVALDPESVDDALSRSDASEWRKAMDEEMHSLSKNDTWSLVAVPPNRNIVTSKWVFKSKTNPDGSLARRKARLVARGFSQKEGVDYYEKICTRREIRISTMYSRTRCLTRHENPSV